MGHTEPALQDAYAVTARAVRREMNRESFIDAEYSNTLGGLASFPMQECPAYWEGRLVAPLMADLIAWVIETDDDPTTTLGQALAFPETSGKALRERFALARAEARANEQERNGIDWLEAA